MKLKFLMTFSLSLTMFCSIAQNNPCNMTWGPWEPILNDNGGGVYYSVQHSDCLSTGICGFPKIGLMHTFTHSVSIQIKLKGIGCDGHEIVANFYATDLIANKELKDQGNFHSFKQVTDILRVDVTYKIGNNLYEILEDRERGINETYINGESKEEILRKKAKNKTIHESLKTTLVNRFHTIIAAVSNGSAIDKSHFNNLKSQFTSLSSETSRLLNKSYFDTADESLLETDLENMGTINNELENEVKLLNSKSAALTSKPSSLSTLKKNKSNATNSLGRHNDYTNNSSVSNSDSLVHSIASFAQALSKVKRTKKLDIYDTNSGSIWLSLGYNRPEDKNDALYNQGFTGQLLLTSFGNHALFSLSTRYTYGLKLDKNYYAALFDIDPNQITTAGQFSSLGGTLNWGPYLFRRKSKLLVLQATGGITGLFFSDFITPNSPTPISLKEFASGGPAVFTYGGALRFISNNFLFSIEYDRQAQKKYFTPEYQSISDGNLSISDYQPHLLNSSSFTVSVGFRLL
jgi:hypothetical protein